MSGTAGSKVVVRVLVCDDSAFMRRAIQKMLEKETGIEVIGTASSGEEGIALVERLAPDVVTMDVEMPGIGGLEAARAIVERRGPPIIMISSLTREGAETTLRALEIGAVDFIPKPDSALIDIVKVQRDLVDRVRHFGTRSAYLRAMRGGAPAPPPPPRAPRPAPSPLVPPLIPPTSARTPPPRPAPPPLRPPAGARYECIALGTSTGGPVALSNVIPKLPAGFPIPLVIVQHMPPGFTRPLAERLNGASRIEVLEGEDGMRLIPGRAIVAPAGKQLALVRAGGGVEVRLEADRFSSLHVPSVDAMATAVGEMFGARAIGVIMTGMGHDGVEGLKTIKARGGYVVGQDEASSVVYGMPRAAAQAGLVDRVVALDDIPRTLCELAGIVYAPV